MSVDKEASVDISAGPEYTPHALNHSQTFTRCTDTAEGTAVALAQKQETEIILEDQTSRMSTSKLVTIFCGLGLSLFLSFLDSTSVATALPTIADDLHAGESIAWVGTSYLVANTSFQLIYGRLSDIFGRKTLLLGALLVFAIGDLLCGFAQTQIQLYVFRAIAGVGGGGINSLTMIIMSDVTSLRERAKWQGFTAGSVAAGSAVGPFVGGAFAQHLTWRWTFWAVVPLSTICAVIVWVLVPLKPMRGRWQDKIAKIDFAGSLLSLAANVCILVPISGGGVVWPWDSPVVITLLIVGVGLWTIFFVIEWKFVRLPVLPLNLFKYRTVTVIVVQTWFVGAVYYGNLYFLPIYFQSLRGMSALTSAAFLLPLLCTQTVSSVLNGQLTMRSGGVKPQIVVGFIFWTIGAGLETTFLRITRSDGEGSVIWWASKASIIGFLIIQGVGVGGTLQTTLVAAQAGAPPMDRAVVTGTRNFARTLGGAFGLAISSAIRNNVIAAKLPPSTPESLRQSVTHSTSLILPDSLSPQIREGIIREFAEGLHVVFDVYVALIGICLCSSFFIQDAGLPDNAQSPAADIEQPRGMKQAEEAAEGLEESKSQG